VWTTLHISLCNKNATHGIFVTISCHNFVWQRVPAWGISGYTEGAWYALGQRPEIIIEVASALYMPCPRSTINELIQTMQSFMIPMMGQTVKNLLHCICLVLNLNACRG
jgi:hypothetical protein